MGSLLSVLGVLESHAKACGLNTRKLFLGILVDTIKMTLDLDHERLMEMHDLLSSWESKSHATLKQVQKLVGVLSFTSSCIRQGHPFFSGILNFLREMPDKG